MYHLHLYAISKVEIQVHSFGLSQQYNPYTDPPLQRLSSPIEDLQIHFQHFRQIH